MIGEGRERGEKEGGGGDSRWGKEEGRENSLPARSLCTCVAWGPVLL